MIKLKIDRYKKNLEIDEFRKKLAIPFYKLHFRIVAPIVDIVQRIFDNSFDNTFE